MSAEPIIEQKPTAIGEAAAPKVEEKAPEAPPKKEEPKVYTWKEGDPLPVGPQKRINDVTRKWREEERKRIAAEQKAAELEKAKEDSGRKPAEDKEPTLDDFEGDYDAYNKAWIRWDRREADREREKATKPPAQEEKSQEPQGAEIDPVEYAKLQADGIATYPDFGEVVLNNDIPGNEFMRDVVLNSERRIDILYYLGQHLDVALEIAQMTPGMAAREILKLEQTLPKQPKNGKRTPSAPDPINPVGGAEASEKPLVSLSFGEYYARRMKERGGKI